MQLSTTLTSTSYLHCTGQHPTSFTNSGRQTVARLVPGRQQPTAETIPKSRKKDRQNKPEPRGVIGRTDRHEGPGSTVQHGHGRPDGPTNHTSAADAYSGSATSSCTKTCSSTRGSATSSSTSSTRNHFRHPSAHIISWITRLKHHSHNPGHIGVLLTIISRTVRTRLPAQRILVLRCREAQQDTTERREEDVPATIPHTARRQEMERYSGMQSEWGAKTSEINIDNCCVLYM